MRRTVLVTVALLSSLACTQPAVVPATVAPAPVTSAERASSPVVQANFTREDVIQSFLPFESAEPAAESKRSGFMTIVTILGIAVIAYAIYTLVTFEP